MEKKVLIASSHQAFADLLRHSLSGSRKYDLKVVLTREDLQELPDQQGFDLVILDADLPDQPLVSGVADLKSENKNIKLVVFPPDNRADHPLVAGLSADVFLKKPFYLPELQETLADQLNQSVVILNEADPEQNKNPEAARYQHILNLILEDSQAAAILLVKEHQPLAFAGDVEANSPTHIMNIIMPHWNAERRSDVVRFKRLQEGGKDYLFYATALNPDVILVVVFERTISLTAARLHTSVVMRKLKSPPAAWMVNQNKSALHQSTAGITHSAEVETAVLTTDDLDWLDEEDDLDGLDETEMVKLEALLSSMPNPNPDVDEAEQLEPFVDHWQPEPIAEASGDLQEEESEIIFTEESQDVHPFPEIEGAHLEAVPVEEGLEDQEQTNPREENEHSDQPEEADPALNPLSELVFPWDKEKPSAFREALNALEGEDELEPTQNIRPAFSESRTIPADLPPIDPLEDTAPRSLGGTPKPVLEPNAPGVSSLNYTSVLLPRFPSQFLSGELTERLGEWLPQLCVAYGWRLERMSIRPQYIQWTVQVPPTVSPGYMVRILREEMSRRIFKRQPELNVDNPADDFWAPGYLVMSGFLPPTQQMLEDYIQQTRRRQGLEPQEN